MDSVGSTVYAWPSLAGGLPRRPTPSTAVSQKLDNATCQTCHDGKKGKLEMLGSNGEKRAVQSVFPTSMPRACMPRWSASPATRKSSTTSRRTRRPPAWPKAECAQCHLDLWESIKKDNKTAEKPRLGIVADNVAAYKKSFHAKPDKDDPDQADGDLQRLPQRAYLRRAAARHQERKEWHLTVPDTSAATSATRTTSSDWTDSVHGKEATEKKNLKTAVCSDCHTTHDIVGSSTDKAKLSITASCGDCHKDA
jgi:hypothetical protein